LAEAGFNPGYERHGAYWRVSIAGIRAGEMDRIARRLGAAGFPEALLRRDR
jgi:hypothetical protein